DKTAEKEKEEIKSSDQTEATKQPDYITKSRKRYTKNMISTQTKARTHHQDNRAAYMTQFQTKYHPPKYKHT
ncbi:hypothetical protein R0K20_21070, partial [Staphylococcus sp. SIMBA_130]